MTVLRRVTPLFMAVLVAGAVPSARAEDPPDPLAGSPVVVRRVVFERVPIFDEADRGRLPWMPLAWIDALHVDTRPSVIRREMLVAPGSVLDPEALAESERKLRRLGIFADVEVRAVFAPGDSVDVLVRTRELWTTSANFSYEKFEDELLWSAQVRERNFLGTARAFDVVRREDVDRASWTFGLADRQLFDGKWQGRLRYSDSSDGRSYEWSLDRPFFRIVDRWSVESSWETIDARPRYYLTSTRYVRPDADFRTLELAFARRARVQADGVWRLGVFYRDEYQAFSAERRLAVASPDGDLGVTAEFDADVPENRRWRTPGLRLQRRTRRYEELRYLYAMGTIEDVPIGTELTLDAGWTTRLLGSDESGLWMRWKQNGYYRSSRHWLHRLQISTQGLLHPDGARALKVEAEFSNYHFVLPSWTLATTVRGGTGSTVDRNRLFSLGLDSGLRAARFREVSGDRVLRGNVELRGVLRRGLYDLVTPGIVVFADYGTAWIEEEQDFRWELVRGAVGFGLRLGLSRGAADLPIRVDLAWPVLYPFEHGGPVLSIGTQHLF